MARTRRFNSHRQDGPSKTSPSRGTLAEPTDDATVVYRTLQSLRSVCICCPNRTEIHDARKAARTAVTTALAESPQAAVARHILGDLAARLVWTDERLARYQGDIDPAQLSDPVHEYLSVTLRAKGMPAACQQLQEALQL